jgi:protein-tyrosine phosphatase
VQQQRFVDIHCHLVPAIDDGASSWDESLAMARMAVADGIDTIICTPHQCGNYAGNRGDDIRAAVAQLQQQLDRSKIPLRVLPGADVRIEANMIQQLVCGDVLTLADRSRHVLLELPHELYMPLEPVLAGLRKHSLVGILSHPERNQGILRRPEVVAPLVEAGCLMQITAGSLMGTFGEAIQRLSEKLLTKGLVHFIATDAHGIRARRPLIHRAFQRAAELVGEQQAIAICCHNPHCVAEGRDCSGGVQTTVQRGWRGLFTRRKAA